jgi:hypothetical protein
MVFVIIRLGQNTMADAFLAANPHVDVTERGGDAHFRTAGEARFVGRRRRMIC